jgi:hypothetical protein
VVFSWLLSASLDKIRVFYNYLESFEMWCWTRMEKITWTDRVKNGEVLQRLNEERNILHIIKRKEGYLDW